LAGASVPVVVATQANLPIHESAALAEQFYRALPQDGGDTALELARARHWAYGNGTAWATPILMRCPAPARDPGQLDGSRPTFRQRPEVLTDGLAALQSSRLVSVVGLPRIGKTEIGKEIARQALARGHGRFYATVPPTRTSGGFPGAATGEPDGFRVACWTRWHDRQDREAAD
jgi:hypothetical protein